MKRKDNLYENVCKIENIMQAFDEVCRNTKNKRKVRNYQQYRCVYISRIYDILINKKYEVGPYTVFTIYEPKERRIVSQNLQDKIINHLVSRQILYPALNPCLIKENVASIKGKGTKAGLALAREFERKCKVKYKNYYILKCDISKFFASINHEILKNKLQKRIKYYVRYQDDFLLFHESKEYLKQCFEEIKSFLKKEKLVLNGKSRLYKNTNNFIFLGRNNNGRYAKYRNVKRKIKYKKYLYETGKIELSSLMNSMNCYNHLLKTRE